MRYFEDLTVGQTIDLGRRTVSAEEIVEFASAWDPQPMHTNAGGMADRLYDGLIASGWHTICLWMRQLCDEFLLGTRSMGSPGVEKLRWTKPVRPGDTLSMTGSVVELRTSKSRPRLGIARMAFETVDQDGDLVMTMQTTIMMERREPAEATA